jgi:ATP-dependent Clp protease ATP-binding subunit ClpX
MGNYDYGPDCDYTDAYPQISFIARTGERLTTPKMVYNYLSKRICKQEAAIKAASLFLFKHVNRLGKTRVSLFCGPTGSGKTYIWDVIRQNLFPHIIFVNSANITRSGYTGPNITDNLLKIDPQSHWAPIFVFDEIDKMVQPSYTSRNENISQGVQSELLALIQPSNDVMSIGSGQQNIKINLKKCSWVFCGSFAIAAEDVAAKGKTSGLGFNAVKQTPVAYEEELTLQNLIDFGMIPELAGRINEIINLHPITLDGYKAAIKNQSASPIRQIEESFHLEHGYIRKHILKKSELDAITEAAFESGLGMRAINSKIQERVSNYIFNNYEKIYADHIDEYGSSL